METYSKKKTIALKYAAKKRARRELRPGPYKTFDAIFDRCGKDRTYTWILTKTLAEDTGFNIGTVRNHLYELEKDLYIFRTKEKQFKYDDNGKNRSIKNARLIHICLFPEKVKKVKKEHKDKIRDRLHDAWKRHIEGKISREVYLSVIKNYLENH